MEPKLLLSADWPLETEMRQVDEHEPSDSPIQSAAARLVMAGIDRHDGILHAPTEGLVIAPTDTVSGNRVIVGDVVNRGVLSPGNSPGIIDIYGDLTIDGSDVDVLDDNYTPGGSDTVGTIQIEIGGLQAGPGDPPTDDGYDRINVTGDVSLGGKLEIVLINDFSPSLGDTFDILTYTGSLSGTFDTASGMFGFGDGSLYFEIVEATGKLQLEVEEAPGGGNIISNTPAINDLLGQYYSEYFTTLPATSIAGELTIDQFVNVQGTFDFDLGMQSDLTVATGLPDDASQILDPPVATLENIEMATLTIGAADVHAFVGINGPYWIDDLDGDGNISWALPDNGTFDQAVTIHSGSFDAGDSTTGITLTQSDPSVTVDGVHYGDLDDDGVVDANETAELSEDALGLAVNNLDVGFTLMKPDPSDPKAAALIAVHRLATFWALKATAEEFAFVGWDEVEVSAQSITINVNNGVAWPTTSWRPVVDFATSFPAETTDTDGDGKIDPAGLEVATGGDPVYLDFDGKRRVGFSADPITLRLSEFVHVTGGFAFEKGPATSVDIATGVPANALDLLEQIGNEIADGLGTAVKDKGQMISDVHVSTFQVGASDVHAFVGVNGPYWIDDLDSDGNISWAFDTGSGDEGSRKITNLENTSITINNVTYGKDDVLPPNTVVSPSATDGWIEVDGVKHGDMDGDTVVDANETAELSEDAMGLVVNDLDIGLVMMQPTIGSLATVLGISPDKLKGIIPKFTALKATADTVAFVGWDEVEVSAENMAINYNNGAEWFGVIGPPVVDFAASFPAETTDTDGDGKIDPAGFEVATRGDPVYLDFDGNQRIGFRSERLTLRLSDFLHITGSFAFEKGPVMSVDVATGLPSSLLDFFAETLDDLTGSNLGTTIKDNYATVIPDVEMATFQIGASNVHAFVGLKGPYWESDLDGDRGISWSFDTGEGGDDSRKITAGTVTIESTTYSDAGPNTILPENKVVRLAEDQVVTVGGIQYGDIDFDDVVDADETAELSENAVGLSAEDVDIGAVIMGPTIASFAALMGVPEETLKGIIPKFTALKATAAAVKLVGFDEDELDLSAQGITINYNNGTEWFGVLGPPVVDFANTDLFADEQLALFDTDRDGHVTVGELRTLAGQPSGAAGVGPFADLYSAANADTDLVSMEAILAALDQDDDSGNTNGLLEISEAEAVLSETSLAGNADVDGDGKLDPLGFEVGTGGDPVYIDFDGNQRIGASVEKVALKISEFVHVTGSLAFEMGPVQTVAIGGGLLSEATGAIGDLLKQLDFPESLVDAFPALGAATTEVSTMTIGASNLHAFVGLDGPYWIDDLDDDGKIGWSFDTGAGDDDRRAITEGSVTIEGATYSASGPNTILPPNKVVRLAEDQVVTVGAIQYGDIDLDDIVDANETAELSEDAAGLVLNDFDFGMAILKPTNPLDFARYMSLNASAEQIGLVGIEGVTAEATKLLVEVNLSSPSVYGLPLFPVVDYATTTQLAGDEQWALFDRDGNGKITVGELRDLAGQPSGSAGTGPFTDLYSDSDLDTKELMIATIVTALDEYGATSNGLLEVSEAQAALSPANQSLATDVDRDGDGVIEPFVSEQAALFDTDRNGIIEWGELRAHENAANFPELQGDDPSDTSPVAHEMLLWILDANHSDTIEISEAAALTGNASDVAVHDVDGDGKLDPVGFEVGTGGAPVYLDMDSPLIRAQGFLELDIFGSLILTGSVAFELGPTQDVTLTNGSSKTVTTMSIGAANVTAFVGANGPYWTDENDDHRVDDPDELNSNAIGLHITDLDLGLLVMASTNVLDLGVYLSGKASVNSFGLVGIDQVAAEGTFDIALNVGLGTSGIAVVDFPASFGEDEDLNDDGDFDDTAAGEAGDLDGDGLVDQGGFEVNTGDPDSPVLLDFEQFLINFQLGGIVTIYTQPNEPVLRLNGLALFEADDTGLGLFVAAGLEFGPDIGSDDKVFDMNALGGLVINSSGIAADIDVSVEVGSALSSLSFEGAASARVIFNTTGDDQSITIPPRYVQFLAGTVDLAGSFIESELDDLGVGDITALSSLTGELDDRFTVNDADGSATFTIFGDAPTMSSLFPDANLPGGDMPLSTESAYFAVAIAASLHINTDWGLDGRFGLIVAGAGFQLSAEANLLLGPIGSLSATGKLIVLHDESQPDSSGVRAQVEVSGSLGSEGLGLTIGATGLFELNTTSQEWENVDAQSIGVAVDVNFNFLGFAEGSGAASVTFADDDFQLVIDGTLSLGGALDVDVHVYVGIFDDNPDTPNDEAGVIVDAAVALDLKLFGILDVDVEGRLQINTTNVGMESYRGATIGGDGSLTFGEIFFVDANGERTNIDANSFFLDIKGDLRLLGAVTISGQLTVDVANNGWTITIPESNPLSADLFGVLKVEVHGFLESSGEFDLHLAAGVDLAWAGNGFVGNLTIDTHLDLSQEPDFLFFASGSGAAKIAGVTVAAASIGLNAAGDLGEHIPITLTVEGEGAVFQVISGIRSFFRWIVSGTWVTRSLGFSVPLGTIRLPEEILTEPAAPPPLLAGNQDGSPWDNGNPPPDRNLYLNVGDRALHRQLEPGTTAEQYTITHLPSTDDSPEKIRIAAFGEIEDFVGVSTIIGNFGSGNDVANLSVGPVDATISGGAGNDSIYYGGTAVAILNGDDGDDDLTIDGTIESPPSSSSVLSGGAHNDTLLNASAVSVTLHGDDGDDNLTGGTGDDIALHGGAGNDWIRGRGGMDTMLGESGVDKLVVEIGDLVLSETADGGDDEDQIVIAGDSSAQDLRVTMDSSGVKISSYSGDSERGSVTLANVEAIMLSGGEGADAFSVTGELNLGGVTTGVVVDTGSVISESGWLPDGAVDEVSFTLREGADDKFELAPADLGVQGVWDDHFKFSVLSGFASVEDKVNVFAGGDDDDEITVLAVPLTYGTHPEQSPGVPAKPQEVYLTEDGNQFGPVYTFYDIDELIIDEGEGETPEENDPLMVDITEDESDGDHLPGDLSLREAVELANATSGADTIVFAPALAGSTITLTSGDLPITDDLTITGLGADQLAISGDHASRIFRVDNAAPTTITVAIRDLSLIDGHGLTYPYGGAIYNQERLSVERCKLANNSTVYGGGIRNDGKLNITNSTFTDNWASSNGGGVYNHDGTLTITNSTFSGNSAQQGGGIRNDATLSLVNSTISSNSATFNGGGIYNLDTLWSTNSTIWGNSAGTSGGGLFNYGTLSLVNSTIAENIADANNDAIGEGGGIHTPGLQLVETGPAGAPVPDNLANAAGTTAFAKDVLNNGRFAAHQIVHLNDGVYGNANSWIGETDGSFAGVNLNGSHTIGRIGFGRDNLGEFGDRSAGAYTIQYTTVADPDELTADGDWITLGELVYDGSFPDAQPALRHVYEFQPVEATGVRIIVSRGGIAGGIAIDEIEVDVLSSRSTTLHNTVVAGNMRADDEADDLSGPVRDDSSHNLIGDSDSSHGLQHGENGNLIGANAMLDPAGLQDHGGPTRTIALLSGSPAINAGNGDRSLDPAGNPLTTDQRSGPFLRSYGAAVDIGAYEAQPLVDTPEDESDGDFSAGDLSLREAIEWTNANPGADTIAFAAGLTESTILLDAGLGELTITDDLTIAGFAGLTISGNHASRIFHVDDGDPGTTINVAIFGLSLVDGASATDGGAIYNQENLTITNSTLANNSANNGGGIFNHGGGALAVVNSTFFGNTASVHGGGIDSRGALSVVNSTISDNAAGGSGGGILNWGGTLSVASSTIADNVADANNDQSGGGGGVRTPEGSFTSLHNTIVAGNVLGTGADPLANDLVGTVSSGSSFNLIENVNSSGGLQHGENGNLVGIDPMLDPAGVQDHGGTKPTIALLADSPAINAGDVDGAFDADGRPLTNDQRGAPFDRIDGAAVDIGAYEVQSLSLTVDTTKDLIDGDFLARHLSLREAIELTNANPGTDTITFDADLAGSTIRLDADLGELRIADDLYLDGREVTVDAGARSWSDYEIGGVLIVDPEVNATISNLTITGGYGKCGGHAASGGGICNLGTLSLVNSMVAGNFASYYGGGIYNGGTLSVVNSTIAGNDAAEGVGIYQDSGAVTVIDSTISDNSGVIGGGVFVKSGTFSLINSTIAGNEADMFGGGIYNRGTLTVTNSTLANNSVSPGNLGGGIYNAGTLTVINSTLASNSASPGGLGGGIYNGGTLTLANSLFGGNTAGEGPDIRNEGTISSARYNVIQDGVGSGIVDGADGNQVGIDPRLHPAGLQDHGGPTKTIVPLSDSPAINAGNTDLALDHLGNPLTNDQRGIPFIRHYDAAVDVGAYEVQPVSLVVDSSEDESDGDFSAGDLTLREAIERTNANPAADTIVIAAELAGITIKLDADLGELRIADDLYLGGRGVTVDAGARSWSDYEIGGVLIVDPEVDATISNLTITGGYGKCGGYAASGGGICNLGTLSLVNSTVAGNFASYYGGGIYNGGTLSVVNSTIAGNDAAEGVGIYQNSGTVTVIDSTISDNSGVFGGGVFVKSGTFSLINSTIAGNEAFERGGGIYNHGTLTVTNSTLANNSVSVSPASQGGGIYNAGALTVINSTLASNSASPVGLGGGIYNGGTLTLANSLFGGNTALEGSDIRDVGAISSARYNVIQDGSGSGIVHGADGNQVGIDPRLDPVGLRNLGGPIKMIALLSDSPAINAGNTDLALDHLGNPLTNDQRGLPFVRHDGAAVDVGAFEAQPVSLVVDIPNDESDGDLSAGDLSLREAIELTNLNPGADTIGFATGLSGSTITLDADLGQLHIADDLTITGLGAEQMTISANHASRIFRVDDADAGTAITVAIRGLSLVNGSRPSYPYGGGIYNQENLTVENCTLANNASDYGGGIRNDGTLTVNNSALTDNVAGTVGGAIINTGALTVTNSTLTNNSAHSGGGILNDGFGTATITNSTLANNSANYEGGGIINDGTLMVTNSTLAYNSARQYGGGISHVGGLGLGGLTLTNTLVVGNTAPRGPDLLNFGMIDAAQYNVILDGKDSGIVNGVDGNQVGIDPLLDPAGLQDHGGPTQTIALLPNSPAINAGNDDLALDPVGNPLTTDQRGLPFVRIDGAAVDIGAYEAQSLSLVVDTAEDESDGDLSAGDLSLREAIEFTNANPRADTIGFAAGLSGNTITLDADLGQLHIASDLTITGLGADQLTISANHASRIFRVDDTDAGATITVAIRGLSLVNGYTPSYPYGGGIYNQENLTLDNSTLANNSSDYGGGIRNDGALTITNSTLTNNSAGTVGGAIINVGALTVTNSTLANNSAHSGGGILNDDFGAATVTNSTLANNSANYAGGGIANAGTLTITNSTLANNSAGSYGGGIEHFSGLRFGTLSLANSLFAGNTAPTGPDIRHVGTISAARYNVIQDGAGSGIVDGANGNQVGIDPLLDPDGLQDHGGSTRTIALLPDSPAVNAGAAAAAAGLIFDQRGEGFARIVGGAVDVGAIERQNAAPMVYAGANQTVDEGVAVSLTASFIDTGPLDTHTATIDWGDGAVEAGVVTGTEGTGSITGSHVYADNGTYTVTVTVADHEYSASDTLEVTINNVAPSLTVVGDQWVDERSPLVLTDLGTFTDLGFDNPDNLGGATRETFTYTIDWGDESALDRGDATIDVPGAPATLTAGSFDGSHLYLGNGPYTVTVTLTDDDGGSATQSFDVTINNMAPTVTGIVVNGGLSDPPNLPRGPQPTSWEQQRSDIRSLVVTFSEEIQQVSAADLVLTNLGVNAPADADDAIPLTDEHLSLLANVLTIHFASNELPDGAYAFEILPTATDLVGNELDGDGDGSGGDSYVLTGDSTNRFHKLAADWNGDGGVSIFDFPVLAYWFAQHVPAAPEYVDLNLDGGVTIFDFPAFAGNFGTGVIYPPSELSLASNETVIVPTVHATEASFKVPAPLTRLNRLAGIQDPAKRQPDNDAALLDLLAQWNERGMAVDIHDYRSDPVSARPMREANDDEQDRFIEEPLGVDVLLRQEASGIPWQQ